MPFSFFLSFFLSLSLPVTVCVGRVLLKGMFTFQNMRLSVPEAIALHDSALRWGMQQLATQVWTAITAADAQEQALECERPLRRSPFVLDDWDLVSPSGQSCRLLLSGAAGAVTA
jgi:hypothetical protein